LGLGEAVDNTSLEWKTGGAGNWFYQESVFMNGGDAARSGDVDDNQSTWLETTATGPGGIGFYWKVSSAKYDFLKFYVDGVVKNVIWGEEDWNTAPETYDFGGGTHTLRWEYTKNYSVSLGSDCGWIDNVFYYPIPLIITSPNGGEKWTKGETRNITWSSRENVGSTVRIDLYKGINLYKNIVASTINDGIYEWFIDAETQGIDYSIRISSGSLDDFSNNDFTIYGKYGLNITSPNGGEVWNQGEMRGIYWNNGYFPDSTVKIYLYRGGKYYTTISSSAPNTGDYSWYISVGSSASSYKIKIVSASNSSVYDYSDNNFYMNKNNFLVLRSPNGGEMWFKGETPQILWDSIGNVGSDVKIYLYRGGNYYRTITSSTPNDGSYDWPIDIDYSSKYYRIKIRSASNSTIYDYSDKYFYINPKGITLASPNGGESWFNRETRKIKWNSIGSVGSDVKINLYRSGRFYKTITSSTPNDGELDWYVDVVTSSSYCKVKVLSTSNYLIYDYSDNYFKLNKP